MSAKILLYLMRFMLNTHDIWLVQSLLSRTITYLAINAQKNVIWFQGPRILTQYGPDDNTVCQNETVLKPIYPSPCGQLHMSQQQSGIIRADTVVRSEILS